MQPTNVSPYHISNQPATLCPSYPGTSRATRSLPSPYQYPSNPQECYNYSMAAHENVDSYQYHQPTQPSFQSSGESGTAGAMYQNANGSRQWQGAFSTTRPAPQMFDHEMTSSRFGPSSNPYAGVSTPDGQGMYSGLSSQPMFSSGTSSGRMLPNLRPHPVPSSDPEAMPPLHAASPDVKLQAPWTGAMGRADEGTATPSPSGTVASDATNMPFLTPSESASSSSPVSSTPMTIGGSSDGAHGLTLPSTYSHHHLAMRPGHPLPRLSQSSTSTTTPYSFGRSPCGSDGTLLNGGSYTPLSQPCQMKGSLGTSHATTCPPLTALVSRPTAATQ